MTPAEVDTETKGRCATCGGVFARDPYAPCNLNPEHPSKTCKGSCHAVYTEHGFAGFCGPLVFDDARRGGSNGR